MGNFTFRLNMIRRRYFSYCRGQLREENNNIAKYLNFSLEKVSLRDLVQEYHKSFYLTVFVGP